MQLRAKERQGWPPSHSRDTHGEGPSQQTQERSGSVFPKETHEKGLDVTHRLRETPIGTTRRCRLTPVGMAVLKNTGDSRRWRGCAERGPLGHCRWEGDLEPPLWRAVWRPLRTSKIELPRYQAIPPLGGYPQERRRDSGRQTCTPVHHCLILNSEDAETTSVHRR